MSVRVSQSIAVTLVMILLAAAGCGNEEPDLRQKFWDYLDCHELASLAVQMSEDKYPASHISEIHRIKQTVDTPTLRECEGSAEFIDGSFSRVLLWAEERPNGDTKWGYEVIP